MLSTDVAPVSVLGAASRPPPIERWKVLTAVGVLIVAVVAWGLTSASTSADLQLPSSPMLSGHPLMEHAADNTGLAPGPTPGLQPDLGAAIPLPVNAAASSLEREPAAERPAAERPAAERPAAKRPTGGPGSEQGELQPSSAERAVVGRRSAAGNNRTLTGKGAAPASVNARVRQPSDSKTVPPPAPKPTPAKSAVPTGYVLDSPY